MQQIPARICNRFGRQKAHGRSGPLSGCLPRGFRRRRCRCSACLCARATNLGALLGEVVVEFRALGRAAVADLSAGSAVCVRSPIHCMNGVIAVGRAFVADFGALLHSSHFTALFGATSAFRSALSARLDASLHFWGHRHCVHLARFAASFVSLYDLQRNRLVPSDLWSCIALGDESGSSPTVHSQASVPLHSATLAKRHSNSITYP